MNKNIILYLSGIFSSQLGSNLFIIAMIVWLKENFDSTSTLGLFLFCSSITSILVSPFSGVWVDRLSPKNIMILSDFINGIIMITIYLIVSKILIVDYLLEFILILTFISSTMTALFTPASLSLIGLLAKDDEVNKLTSWSSNISEISQILGKSIAGILIAIINPSVLILGNGISFLISSFLESKIQLNQNYQSRLISSNSYFLDLKEGFSFLLGNKLLISLFLGAAGTNFFMAINGPLLPTLIKDVMGYSLSWYGFIMSAFGVGALFGGYLARKVSKKVSAKYFSVALLMQGIPFIFIPIVKHPLSIFMLIMIVGVFYIFVQVNMLTIVTRIVPAKMRGRIFSLMFSIVGLFVPLSYLMTGNLVDKMYGHIPTLYTISGLGIPTVWILALIFLKNSHQVAIRSN